MEPIDALVLLHFALEQCKHLHSINKIIDVDDTIRDIESADLIPILDDEYDEHLLSAFEIGKKITPG